MPIKPDLPRLPEFGAPLAPTHQSPETLQLLALRRSTPVAMLGEPGPSAADLDAMLRLAMRVPDHRKLEPWRVLIIEGEAREKLGDIFAAARSLREPDATPRSARRRAQASAARTGHPRRHLVAQPTIRRRRRSGNSNFPPAPSART